MAVAIVGWALPSSAIEYIAHWDFSSDALGEAEELNNYPLVNHGVTIADGTLMTERNPQYTNASIANLRSEILYIGTRGGSSLPFVGELDDIKITGRVLDPSEFMTKRSSPPGVTITIR